MKILRLNFKNINSFYGAHEAIDFTRAPLSHTGLFIISGPTGAGKSTLLDVITLALYNEVPRLDKAVSKNEIDKLGSIVNLRAAEEPRTEAYAEVEFEVKSGRYRSTWSISKNRAGNWNNYQMEIAMLPEGRLLEVKGLSDYPKKNAELIGLTYEQFIKSIILAQGSFAEFLKADKNTRGKLLEDITGSRIYRQLGERSFAVWKESAEKLRMLESEMKGVQLRTPDEIQTLQEAKDKAEKERDAAAKERLKWETELALAEQEDELRRKLLHVAEEKGLLGQQAAAFAESAEKLKLHETVVEFAGPLASLKEKQRIHTKLREDEQVLIRKREELEETCVQLLATAGKLSNTDLHAETLVSGINAFENRVLEMEGKIKERRTEGNPLLAAIQNEIRHATYQELKLLPLKDIDGALGVLEKLSAEQEKILEVFPGDFLADKRLEELSNHLVWYAELGGAVTDKARIKAEGNAKNEERKAAEADVARLVPEIGQLREKIEAQAVQVQKKTEQLVEGATRKSLDQYREQLKAGEPCPLCGSLEHPFVHTYTDLLVGLGEGVEQLKRELKALETQDKEKTARLKSAEDKIILLKTDRERLLTVYAEAELRIKENCARLRLDPSEITIQALEKLREKVAVERELVGKWQVSRELLAVVKRLSAHFHALLRLRAEVQALEADLGRIYSGKSIQADVKAILSAWDKWQEQARENAESLAANIKEQKAVELAVVTLTGELTDRLQEKGIANIADAETRMLAGAVYQELKKEHERLTEISNRLAVQESTLKEELRDKNGRRMMPALEIETLRAKTVEIRLEHERLLEQFAALRGQVEQETEKRMHFAVLEKTCELQREQHRKWELLKRYIGDAAGNGFSNFAQSLTLNNLIGLANSRLSRLSDRYILEKPRNDTDSLFVLDTYQGNASRSVTTLSGGETFTISLALALALSDMASRNVRIESLFIDEGFGTLDAETLESAVTILEKLQYESGKMVGVISHRQEMKDRIPVQIQVEKGSNGASYVQITG